ncbi:hypothetical protein [Marinospirillum sp.]|uniref:hypothetical protein n=1 Tax=Marinospirillum sp. TaxID=2183934 RepID=UPI0028708EBC|nr:hypothetical protein [Marinospirillum sp.]MDR9467599.1 hypothetical protein [Marinospirillum sp.]
MPASPGSAQQPDSMTSRQKSAEEEVKESRAARERERLQWEEEERQRKIDERQQAEKERLEAERRSLYAELEGMDYDLLSLVDYPTDHEIYAAKRARTLWFIALGSALFLFLASLLSLTSPWVGGIAGGIAFVLWLTHGAGMMSYFPSLNRYPMLVNQRKKLKRELIEYIRNIEGRLGYIHRIYPLVEFNPRLGTRRFKRLALMSKEHTLLANLRTLQDTKSYYEFMVEALKAYQELLQKEKEDAFVQSMDFDPDVLEEQAQEHEDQEKKPEESAEQEKPATSQDNPSLIPPKD